MAALPLVVAGALLDNLIGLGTHDSLHSLINMMVNGSMGAVTYANTRAAFTLVRRNRLQDAYLSGHQPNQLASATPPAPTQPPPINPGQIGPICRCIQCFHFLRREGFLRAEGFDNNQNSYLWRATRVHDREGIVAQYIVKHTPAANLLDIQRATFGVWQPAMSSFSCLAPFGKAMKAYVARIQDMHDDPALPLAPIDYGGLMTPTEVLEMAYWLDTETATILQSWQIEMTSGFNAALGTMYHRVIVEKNPHRCAMLVWLLANYYGGLRTINSITPTSLNPLGAGWNWPPIAVALYMGDTKAIHAMSNLPVVHFNVAIMTGGFNAGEAIGAIEALNWRSFDAFKAWLPYASRLIVANDHTDPPFCMLRLILMRCSTKRVQISAEPLPAGMLVSVHRRSKVRRRQVLLDVALSFIYKIQEMLAHTAVVVNGNLTVIKLWETELYRDWVKLTLQTNRVANTRFCRDVSVLLSALDRTVAMRDTRSGRDFMDVD